MSLIKEKKFKWINNYVKVNIPMSKSFYNLCKDAEYYDLKRDRQYFNCADAIDLSCKSLFTEGKITKKQWSDMNRKYPDISLVSDDDY